MALLVFSAMTKILDFGVGSSHVGYLAGSLWSEAARSGECSDGTCARLTKLCFSRIACLEVFGFVALAPFGIKPSDDTSQISARVYATEITAEGETMRVHVAVGILDARIDLEVVAETQNADIALEPRGR